MKQTTLFDLEVRPEFQNRSVKAVTFQGKLSLPIHRWYRLTPSFSPNLADDIADHFQLGKNDLVLDPFSGVATVPLCMKYRGISACSVEINPYLHFVGTVKTRTYIDLDAIERCFADFIRAYRRGVEKSQLTANPASFLWEHQADIPRISKPKRWWSPGNLAQLVRLRQLVSTYDAKAEHLDLIKMGILGILIPVSNAKHNHVSLTFAGKPLPTVDVVDTLQTKYHEMITDLQAVSGSPCAEVTVYKGNSKELTAVLPKRRKVSAIITSPPYPNRFSYARETRPHMFFFDFIKDAKSVGQLETDAIGGTWGKATSVLARGVAPCNELVQSVLAPYVHGIHKNGDLMAYYVTKYFNDMYAHAEQIDRVCKRRCQLAYVIGNSKFYDNPLPSDEILARIFEYFGFILDRIDRMRRRQSKKGLYEAVVFMRRGVKRKSKDAAAGNEQKG